MTKIKLMNKIAAVGIDIFDRAAYEIGENVAAPDAIMVRSAALHEMPLNPELLAIARCGAGVNNIPVDACAEKGVVVFNTPGANANGVKELAVAALILASRDIIGGVEWVKTLAGETGIAKTVEKGKSAYVGREVAGKTLGVIGLGAIGGMVANTATALGMHVIGCDPYMTVNAAWSLSRAVVHAAEYDEIYAKADYITLHVPATPTTKNMINKETIAKMKDGVRIINLARADLVNVEDMKAALASGKVAAYVTDFPTDDMVGTEHAICIPHLGASTIESEDNCAVMAAHQLDEYIRTGNIRNSVNYPAVAMPHTGAARLCVLHKNVPALLSQITTAVAEAGLNIENLTNGSKGEYAYTIVELSATVPEVLLRKCEEIGGVIRVRAIG